ncbi:MAG: Polysaccharide biosynthesis protein [candidate division WWE3 bacterium GW2011_GWF2_41_45]|nr:MAG: Polysaccharide biosynthesis protein [candidate division WWE3 bacterium GW2011_GWC2_41_23]KKS10603.1 MAG: Polysaccharide biosynthesis protein [candidate division WWE3 bacterium GW2011_GWF2_41_45]KKS12386.1 MAG: Polysaccharide biosynthesis protein [candidate division WWE3 bacterium GW2011_GWF1_41_53]KKS27270.1 MAG: Membrane protein involved in the export of O-antigen and teichoic acid [candidate division WWE3 bacterium GW2011_GWC1_42_102]KKS51216.1 MAG: Polysaccharide biosynthesis protein
MNFSGTSKKIAANTIYQLIGKIVSLGITVLATVIITRTYGREIYGQFSLMQAWPALFFVIVDFGINAIATREISKDWSKAGKYFGNILLIRIIFSIILMLVLFVASRFFPYSQVLKTGITLSLLLILTQALFTSTNIIFQARLRYDLSTIGYLIGYAFILVIIFFLSRAKVDVMWISFSYVIGGFITFFVNYYFVRSLGVKPEFVLDKQLWGYLLSSSLPLGLMFVFSQINFKADALLLSVLPVPAFLNVSNNEAVGLYALPYKIFEVALVMPTFFMNSLYPVMVLRMTEGKEKLKETLKQSLKFLIVAALVFSAVGYVFSPLAINVLGGVEFEASILVLRILLSGLVLYSVTQPLAWVIVTMGYQKYLPGIYLASGVFNLVMNFIFIPVYSFYMSAVITHFSELLILILLIVTVRKIWRKTYAA